MLFFNGSDTWGTKKHFYLENKLLLYLMVLYKYIYYYYYYYISHMNNNK